MALTGPRLAGLVAVGAAAVALALLPPSPEYWDRRGGRGGSGLPQARVEQIERAVTRAERRLRAAETRDRIRASLRDDPIRPGDRPRLRIEAALAPHLATALRASWDSLVTALEPYHPAAGLAVVLLDAPAGLSPRHWQYLPEVTDGRTCVAVAELGRWRMPWPDRTHWLRRVLGPCAFYAAFGPPGARVREWLDGGAMQTAYVPTWDTAAPRRRAARDALTAGDTGIVQRIALAMTPPRRSSLEHTACAAGRRDWCDRYLATDELAQAWAWGDLGMPGVIANRAALLRWYDPDVVYFLSDLVRLRGRERFAGWWRSTGAADSAFAATYGASLDRWTMQWIRQGGSVRTGPYVRRASVLTSVLFAVTLVLAAVWYVTRRQVA